jgi:hypothetical protein
MIRPLRLFQTHFFFGLVTICILVLFPGCKKTVTDQVALKENIQLSEITEWAKWYTKTIPGAPKLLIAKAEKTFYNNRFYVRVPVEGSTGMIYFGKSTSLEAVFIRINPDKEPVATYPFTGNYEFIDMNKFTYKRITFINGNAGQVLRSQTADATTGKASPAVKVNSWFSQLLYCIANYIVAVPAKVNGEWTGCWILGGGAGGNEEGSDGPGEVQNVQPGDGGGGIDWSAFLMNINPPLTGPDPIPQGGYGTWSPYIPPSYNPPADPGLIYGQVAGILSLDIEVSADIEDVDIGYDTGGNSTEEDNAAFQQLDLSQPFPTKNDIMGTNNFVERISTKQNCMDIAKMQIGKLGYKIGGYDPGGQTFQIYKRSTGINKTQADKGVSYIIDALQKNKPVIVGVDHGNPSPNLDNTTNHFIVVVGMGSDSHGNFLRYYDNITSDIIGGTNPNNKLYYDATTGLLKGTFPGTPKVGTLQYIVSIY